MGNEESSNEVVDSSAFITQKKNPVGVLRITAISCKVLKFESMN